MSLSVARKVLPFLGQRGIPATPENYMIFYLYFEGELPIVRRVVDEHLGGGQAWTPHTTMMVFDQLFSSEANLKFWRENERIIQQVRETTRQIVERSDATARLAEKTSRECQDNVIKHHSEALGAENWLRDVLQEIRRMGQASSSFSGDLRDKATELEKTVEALDRLEVLALTDELTGLANRRAWDSRIKAEFNRFVRYHRPCSLIMLDIDDFKLVNDRHGHLMGDKVLVGVADMCKEVLRTIDFMARFGGEEFTCLLPETNLDAACMVAERLRSGVAGQGIRLSPRVTVHITASFGVSCFHNGDQRPQDALDRADRTMYRAKQLGKNMVCGERELAAAS